MDTIETACPQGKIRGNDLDGVYEFLGIPYAQDTGRFRYAGPAPTWDGTRDATQRPSVFPQKTHQIKVFGADGPVEMEQDENSFVVNVWTPGMDDAARPVIIWIHGGGWSEGSGSYPSSSGAVFARRQDAVFVTADYRLGALGNISLPGIADDNLAVHDCLAVLDWVQQNIAAFGGDPGNVCLSGQSAGAWMAITLAGLQAAQGKFSKLMLMSTPSPSLVATNDIAKLTQLLISKLGMQDNPAQLLETPVERIVEMTLEIERDYTSLGVAFTPYDDGQLETGKVFERAAELSGNVPLLDGVTKDEAAMMLCGARDQIDAMQPGQLGQMAGSILGSELGAVSAFYDERFPQDSSYDRAVRLVTDVMFAGPANQIASAFENSYGYRIDLESANPDLRACHCMDLPLLFGNMDVYANDPMLEGNDMEEIGRVSERFQASVGAFMRTGCPETEMTPSWPRFKAPEDRVHF